MGYIKKQSLPSLLAGGGSGALVFLLTLSGYEENKEKLKLLSGLLFFIMAFRVYKSGNFMPAGVVVLISAGAFGILNS